MKRAISLLFFLSLISLACRAGAPATPLPGDPPVQGQSTAADLPATRIPATEVLPASPTVTGTPLPTIFIPTRQPAATGTAALPAPTLPERDLDPEGPFLLIQAESGLYALNEDGSGLTLLTDETHIDLQHSLSPDRTRLAYVTMMIPGDYSTLELFMYHLPTQELERITRLTPPNTPSNVGPDHASFEALRAIYDESAPAWSPDGNTLAFMGAQDGPSSDLYVYRLDTAAIERLTDGPSQGYGPSWSPDGSWIVHFGVDSFGTGAGFSMRGAWAANANSKEVLTLYRPTETAAETVVGWVGPQTVMVHSWDMVCGAANLRLINIVTQAVSVLWADHFDEYSLAFDPHSGSVVFSAMPGCDQVTAGMVLVRPDGSRQQLTDMDGYAVWSNEAGVFTLRTKDAVSAFTPQGQAVDLGTAPAVVTPAAAPGAAYWAWPVTLRMGEPGLYISNGSSIQKKYAGDVTWAKWSPDGETVIFGDSDGQLFAARAPHFQSVLIWEGIVIHQDPVWAGSLAQP